MLHKLIAIALAVFTSLAMPFAAVASSYGELTLAPSYQNTYALSTAFFTPATSATVLAQCTGSSTKTIKIIKIYSNYSVTSSSDNHLIYVVKKSAPATGGSSTACTSVPYDSTAPSGTATAAYFTANPSSAGTSVGQISAAAISPATTGGTVSASGNTAIFDADKYGEAITLHGTSETCTVESGGVTFSATGPKVQYTYVVIETK